jgi:hypothetical protein
MKKKAPQRSLVIRGRMLPTALEADGYFGLEPMSAYMEVELPLRMTVTTTERQVTEWQEKGAEARREHFPENKVRWQELWQQLRATNPSLSKRRGAEMIEKRLGLKKGARETIRKEIG